MQERGKERERERERKTDREKVIRRKRVRVRGGGLERVLDYETKNRLYYPTIN